MSTIKNKNEIEYFKKRKRNRVGEHMSLYETKEIKECGWVTLKKVEWQLKFFITSQYKPLMISRWVKLGQWEYKND